MRADRRRSASSGSWRSRATRRRTRTSPMRRRCFASMTRSTTRWRARAITASARSMRSADFVPATRNRRWPRRSPSRSRALVDLRRGGAIGGKVGYATRLDSKQSAATRLLVMTPGLFRNRILAGPELAGVSAVLFDEVHERSLDGDFALALAIDAQQGLRDDIRLVAMSATLDGARFGALLGNAPVIKREGKIFPLDLRHIGRRAED